MKNKLTFIILPLLLCLFSCSQNIEEEEHIEPQEPIVCYNQLEENLYLKIDEINNEVELKETYDENYELVIKSKIDFYSIELLWSFLLEQYGKEKCNDAFYFFKPPYSVDDTVPQAKKLGDFNFYYDSIKKIKGEEIYINPVVYYNYHLSEYDKDAVEDYTFSGFFLPTKSIDYNFETSVEKGDKKCNAIVKCDNKVISSIFYSDSFINEKDIKALINCFSDYTIYSNWEEKFNEPNQLSEGKTLDINISESKLREKLDNCKDKKACWFINNEGYKRYNSFLYNKQNSAGKYEGGLIKQIISRENSSINGNKLEYIISIAKSDPIIYAVYSWFLTNNNNEDIKFNYSNLTSDIVKVEFLKGSEFVGVSLFVARNHFHTHKVIEDYITNNLKEI